jgi:hypothetical protein
MFGRFRKTNDPAQETDSGAVAVEERERERAEPATSVATPERERERAEPATSVATPERERAEAASVATPERDRVSEPATTAAPADGPAAREQRLAELHDTPNGDAETRVAERDRAVESDRFAREDRDVADEPAWARDDEPRAMPAVVGEDTVVAMRARQRDRFGGIRWGSAFFGLLSAIGLAALLLGIVAAAGVAIGVSQIENVTNGDADTIGLGGAILVLAALAVSWYCGGYVAGRMARFDGARQGVGVWAWTIAIGAVLAIAAVIGGSEWDVLQQLNLPNVAVGDESLTTTGLITLAAALVVTLVFGVLGGKAGEIFHRRVDRFAAREYVGTP